MRRAARIDPIQPEIVAALRAIGATVWVIGIPVDLLAGYRGRTTLLEVKSLTGKRKPKAKGYTPLQESFLATWRGGPVATVTDVEGAIRAVTIDC
ncbi:MAG: hypothetical protein QG616_1983 [Pseudomonadota bacterium]|jgi:hypothetical protein|nr:hypothetical protein [Pseudomonadota bacterium]